MRQSPPNRLSATPNLPARGRTNRCHSIRICRAKKLAMNEKQQILTAEFFEEYPLYRKYGIELPDDVQKVRAEAIRLFCPVCRSENTFTGALSFGGKHKNQPHPTQIKHYAVSGKIASANYTCASCNDYRQFFQIYFDEGLSYAMKTGQFPAWSVAIEKSLSTLLGEHTYNYRKGLICEGQGYGIGAYAYYRRIVESIIDKLLSSIHDLLDENERSLYEKSLRDAQQGIVAQEKIALVKDLIPKSLRPANVNPLSILHDTLSVGIHTLTDDECLKVAGDIREVLTYLVEQIDLSSQTKSSAHRFTDSMKRLLERRSLRS